MSAAIKNYRLCYVDGHEAWFTDAADVGAIPEDDFTGSEGVDVLRVFFIGPFDVVIDGEEFDQMRKGEEKWLVFSDEAELDGGLPTRIALGEFMNLIRACGGEVYLPSGRLEDFRFATFDYSKNKNYLFI